MGKLSRTKGIKWEQAIARWFQAFIGNGQRELDETREGNTGDVTTTLKSVYSPEIRLKIQAKHMKQPNVWKALQESDAYLRYPSNGDQSVTLAAAVVKRHGGETMVAMRPTVFAFMLATMYEAVLRGDLLIPGDLEWPVHATWMNLTGREEPLDAF